MLESLNDFPLYLFDIPLSYNSLIKKPPNEEIIRDNISNVELQTSIADI